MAKKDYYIDGDGCVVLPSNTTSLPPIARYDGKPKIKRADVKMEYTEAQLEEIARCAQDVEYFLSNYCFVVHPDKGKHKIELYPFQYDFVKHLDDNRFSIILAPRQCGKSTITAMYVLHYILFNNDKKAIIMANKLKIAKEIFQKVRIAYEGLPPFLQAGVVEWQKTSCTLENGSSCSAEATSADGMRGIAGNLIILDEFAFLKRNIADEFFTSMYPTISASKKAKLIIISTPNGMNHYHDIWNKAVKKKNTFAPFKVEWNDVPGRDANFREETIKNLGKIKWNQEYACSFIGSSKTLIKPEILECLEASDPLDIIDTHLKIFEEPIAGNNYVCGVDSAKGTGGDYSVIQVLDISAYPFRQVAVYRNNEISTVKFGTKVYEIATKYNEAFVMCENNDIGQAVVDKLWHELEYENLVNYTATKANRRDVGIRATKKTKSMGCDLIQEFFEDGLIEVFDLETIYELSKFEETTTGIFKAEDGEHDDTVMALLWALFIIKTNYIDKDDDIKASRDSIGEEQDDEPLMPIIDQGNDFEEDPNFLYSN